MAKILGNDRLDKNGEGLNERHHPVVILLCGIILLLVLIGLPFTSTTAQGASNTSLSQQPTNSTTPAIRHPKATNQTIIPPTPASTLTPTPTVKAPKTYGLVRRLGFIFDCSPVAPVGYAKYYDVPLKCDVIHAPLPKNILGKIKDLATILWPQVQIVLTTFCWGGLVIYVVIFWMLSYWGYREKVQALFAEARKYRAPVKFFSFFIYELVFFIVGPLIYPGSWLLRILSLFVYLLTYALAAIIGVIVAVIVGILKRLREWIIAGARSWVRNGKALYHATRHFDKNLDIWHKQFTHSVDLHVQLITGWKNISQYFMESGFLKKSTQLGRTNDAITTLSTVIRDEMHSISHRKKAVDSLLGLAENCYDCSLDELSQIEQTLLLLAQDTALDIKIRVRAAWVLTLRARRSIPRGNPAYFSEKSAYQAWKDIASDRQLKPIAVRIGAINMVRKRLGHVFLAQRELCNLLISDLYDRKNTQSEFCIRAAHTLLLMMCDNGNHSGQDATVPLKALRQMSLCETCSPELQYLAVFGLGEFAQRPEALKAQLLRPQTDDNQVEPVLIPYIEETGHLLQRLTKAGKRDTRLKAVAALQRFGRVGILEKLANTAEWKQNDNLIVRKCAARHLARLDSKRAAKAWRSIAEDADIDILNRLEAAEQALMNGEQYGHQFLLQIGANNSGEHRLLAAQALIRCTCIEEGRSILILLSRDITHDRHLANRAFNELAKLPS